MSGNQLHRAPREPFFFHVEPARSTHWHLPQGSDARHSGQAVFCCRMDLRAEVRWLRVLITKHGDSVRLDSRNGLDKAYCFPELVDEIRPIPHDFVADGELVILDHKRLPAMGSIAEAARQQEPAKDSPRIDRGSCSDLRVRSTLARRCGLPETDSPRA